MYFDLDSPDESKNSESFLDHKQPVGRFQTLILLHYCSHTYVLPLPTSKSVPGFFSDCSDSYLCSI